MEDYSATIERVKPVARQFIAEYSLQYPIRDSLQVISDLGYYIIKSRASGNLSGFYMNKENYPFIFVNTNHSLGRQNFSLWHEVYHHYMNHNNGISDFNSNSIEEREAEIFAGCVMLPDEEINKLSNKVIDKHSIAQLSDYYQMSYNAVVVRLMQEKCINYDEYKGLKNLSHPDNVESLKSLYTDQMLSTRIIEPTQNVVISQNIYDLLSRNYKSNKISGQSLNTIIDRIEGLENV